MDKSGSSHDEVDCATASFVSEHEVCYDLCCDKDPVDCVEVLHACSGIRAYLSHQGKSVPAAVDLQFTSKKSLQQPGRSLSIMIPLFLSYMQLLLRMFPCARNYPVSALM